MLNPVNSLSFFANTSRPQKTNLLDEKIAEKLRAMEGISRSLNPMWPALGLTKPSQSNNLQQETNTAYLHL